MVKQTPGWVKSMGQRVDTIIINTNLKIIHRFDNTPASILTINKLLKKA